MAEASTESIPIRNSSISKPPPDAVPLDSHQRTLPIHPSIPSIKVPSDSPHTNLNPITLQAFTESELKQNNFEKLRLEFLISFNTVDPPSEGQNDHVEGAGLNIEKLNLTREDTARELRSRIEEREEKSKEIEREMDKKEKTREVERKVYRKKIRVSTGGTVIGGSTEDGGEDGNDNEKRENGEDVDKEMEVEMGDGND